MADFDLELEGFERVLESLGDIEDDIRGAGTVTVGTGVEYAVYLEFGTSDMDPTPFFRPALAELRVQGVEGFIATNNDLTVEQIDDLDSLVEVVALSLERRIKEIIRKKSLIDTGTLRASVLAIPGDSTAPLPGEAEFSGFDSDNPAPPDAGKALTETISLDL